MVIFSIFNNGKSLVEANYSTSTYMKQIEVIEENVNKLLPKLPAGIQEAAVRLASKDMKQRPTSQLLALIKFFSDPVVSCLQSLDSIDMKDPNQKSHFYRTTLVETLPLIPKVITISFKHVNV
ncbi:hypothetical protein Anas_09263 [Armadillidium nasatum]|uniref:Uncharacterized protein n=1 Tax=Armadillidium nasatum TaxID=96803 RepID=A0A5N5T6V0_9CRUS|nr:hypothetical protein Anas_09263 [Armadillidium nasatum]